MATGSTHHVGGRGAAFDYNVIEAGHYDRVYHARAGIRSKWHHLKFDRVRRSLSPGQCHLDIGCGSGTFIGTVDESIESVGVDIAQPQIRYARANYGTPRRRFQVIDGARLPFDDDAFDAVTCVELVEHLPRDEGLALFVEARRVLRPGGVFVVTTPDYGGLWPIVEWLLNRLDDISYEEQHITRFNRKRLSRLLKEAGFDDLRIGRHQFLAPFAAALGWGFADLVARCEPEFLAARLGLLLIAEAR